MRNKRAAVPCFTRLTRCTALQDPQQAEFAGDNFIRWTGDVKNFAESQLYEITAQEIGSDIHMNALPTLTAKVCAVSRHAAPSCSLLYCLCYAESV